MYSSCAWNNVGIQLYTQLPFVRAAQIYLSRRVYVWKHIYNKKGISGAAVQIWNAEVISKCIKVLRILSCPPLVLKDNQVILKVVFFPLKMDESENLKCNPKPLNLRLYKDV